MSDINLIKQFQDQTQEAINFLDRSLQQVSVGRATANMLDGVKVSVYDSQTPLPHIASVQVADSQTLFVTVWDKNNLAPTLKALEEQTKFQISDLGDKIRVKLPIITAEYREDVSKTILDLQEKTFITFRNIRHNILAEIKKEFKEKLITEDEQESANKDIEQALKDQKEIVLKMISTKITTIKTL